MTERDWLFLDWLQSVRLCSMRDAQTILGVLGGKPITLNTAQIRVRKLVELGKVKRMRPSLQQESVLWASQEHTGVREPRPVGALSRHMQGVAAVSAYLIARGWNFEVDRRRRENGTKITGEYESDGIATNPQGHRVLIEVELSRKDSHRYRLIAGSQKGRVQTEGISGIWYFVAREARTAVETMISEHVDPVDHARYQITDAFDARHEFELPRVEAGTTAFAPVGYAGLTNRYLGLGPTDVQQNGAAQ